MICSSLKRLLRTTPPLGPERAILNGEVTFPLDYFSGGRSQVKSTIYQRRGVESYSLNVHGPRRQLYPKGAIDFFAVYLIPIDTWYIFPFESVGGNFSLHFTRGNKRGKYERYREAWHLLKEAGDANSHPTKTA